MPYVPAGLRFSDPTSRRQLILGIIGGVAVGLAIILLLAFLFLG